MATVTLTMIDLPDGTVEMKLRSDPKLDPETFHDGDLTFAQTLGAEAQMFVRHICECEDMDGPAAAEGRN